MKLRSCRKNKYGRCVEPEETMRKLEPVINEHFDYWTHDEQLSPSLFWSALFIEDMDFHAMGKGVDPDQSRAGVLAETVELLLPRPVEELPGYVIARQDELENRLGIEELLQHIANATPPMLARIKSLDCAQYWVDGYSLLNDKTLKIPIEYIKMISGTSGGASGNRLEEAIVHASNEVFERRVHATVLKNKMIMPTIDPETIENPLIREQLEFVREHDIEVTIKDLSFDGALPCVGAYFKDRCIPPEYQFHHAFKVGASFNSEMALLRVFTEYGQGRRKDEFSPRTPEQLSRVLELEFRRLRTQDDSCDNLLSAFVYGTVPYRNGTFLEKGDRVPFRPKPGYEDCIEDIAQTRRICEMLNKDFIVVDLSDPKTGFAVVRVVIPGYSDVLPFHPPSSPILVKQVRRPDVLKMYS